MSAEKQYIDLFEQHRNLIERQSAPVMNNCRSKAMEAFKLQGFPTRRLEGYKYTDVARIMEPDYGMNLGRVEFAVNPYEAFKCDVPNMGTSLHFVVNDLFFKHSQPATQPACKLPEGVIVDSLKNAAQNHPELVGKYYAQLADVNTDAMNAFNTAFVQDGVFIFVPRNTVVRNAMQVVNILKSEKPMLLNRRMLVVLEEDAELKLLVCDHAQSNAAAIVATQVIEAFVGENAQLDLYELEETNSQCTRIANLYVNQEAGSHVVLNGMTLSNGLTRNKTHVCLAGEQAELSLAGMVIADQEQKVDANTFVDHKAPHCTSKQLFKYVLDDQATGAFAGLVMVRPGAHHTHSEQVSRNLCATRQARMFAQPQLEIYNDDVKCNHGATVGQLDEQALFYMRQRGIPMHEARLLLMFAFVNDVVDLLRIEALRERIHKLVEKRFRGELNKGCHGCDLCSKA